MTQPELVETGASDAPGDSSDDEAADGGRPAAAPTRTARFAKPAAYTQVVRGSVWFTVAVGIGAVGGLVYWSMATRINGEGQTAVSQGAKLFAFLLFVNYLSGMGIPVAVARFAPANTKSVNTLFAWGLLYTAVSSVLGSLGFLLVGSFVLGEQVQPLFEWGVPFGVLLFVVLVTGQSFAILVEIRLVTMRLWGWVLARVLLVVLLRLPLFAIPSFARNPVGLFVIMAGSPALSGLIGAAVLYFVPPKRDRVVLRPLPAETRFVWRYATVNWVAMLAAQAPQFVFPLIVSKFVGDQYGAFYVAWTIVTVVFLVPHTVGQTVLAEGSRPNADTDRQAKLGLFVAGTIMIVMTIGAYVLGGVAVRLLFGDSYELAAQILPRMVAAGIPWALTAILLARARVYQQQLATVTITAGFAVATLLPASVLAAMSGVPGAATAWLLGNIVAAMIALGTALLSHPGEAKVQLSS